MYTLEHRKKNWATARTKQHQSRNYNHSLQQLVFDRWCVRFFPCVLSLVFWACFFFFHKIKRNCLLQSHNRLSVFFLSRDITLSLLLSQFVSCLIFCFVLVFAVALLLFVLFYCLLLNVYKTMIYINHFESNAILRDKSE